jgi:membrane-bound lytic murein transglycosylase D
VEPDIKGLSKPLTQSFITRYSTGGTKQWFLSCLERGYPFYAFVKQEIDERGMPAELLYLPLIESEYNTKAKSSTGAAGLWQFMQNSISPWLKINEWVDERYDFWSATEAALSKLLSNYKDTKDWPLALASYNSGSGAIKRLLQQHNGADYWYLTENKLVKSETINYIPKLIAVYYLASNPRRTGFEDFWPPSEEWARVRLPKQTDINHLSRTTGIPLEELKNNNSELKRNVTPPGADYFLKVKAKDRGALLVFLERGETILAGETFHVIVKGDTVYGLARLYGVREADILSLNPGLEPSKLQPGSSIAIPAM